MIIDESTHSTPYITGPGVLYHVLLSMDLLSVCVPPIYDH